MTDIERILRLFGVIHAENMTILSCLLKKRYFQRGERNVTENVFGRGRLT